MKTTKEYQKHTREIMAAGYVSRSGYMRGDRVYDMGAFVRALKKREPFYWRHKFMAAGFIERWSFVQIQRAIDAGVLVYALKIEREND